MNDLVSLYQTAARSVIAEADAGRSVDPSRLEWARRTMECVGCGNPDSGLVVTGCRACTLREIAQGPHFFASIGRSLTPHYRLQLRALGDEREAHKEVLAVAKTVYTGARG